MCIKKINMWKVGASDHPEMPTFTSQISVKNAGEMLASGIANSALLRGRPISWGLGESLIAQGQVGSRVKVPIISFCYLGPSVMEDVFLACVMEETKSQQSGYFSLIN